MTSSRNPMKAVSADESLGSFIFLSVIMIFIIMFSLIAFFVVNNNMLKHIFSYFSSMIMIFIVILLFFIIILFLATVYVYRTKKFNPILLYLLKIELDFLLPVLIAYSGFFKVYKVNIKNFFINLNNIIVRSGNYRVNPEKILLLLPHCLQNSECSYKITNNISNCKKCMKCNIGRIKEIGEKLDVRNIEVVTGGTAARNIIPKLKPDIIIAIACEGDLAAGISDVKKIPILGILNQRPNGPCYNTTVNIDEIEGVLKKVIY